MCMNVWLQVYLCTEYVQNLNLACRGQKEGIGYPVTRITDGCEIPGGY